MKGMEAIRDRILKDAEAEASQILHEAAEKAEHLKKDRAAAAEQRKAQLSKEYDTKAVDLKKRMIAVAQLDMRKNTLAAKQEMLDKAFDACLESADNMPQTEYLSFMEALLIGAAEKGTEEIIFSARDDARIPDTFLQGVNDKMTEMGKTGALVAATEKRAFRGGFIMRSGGMERNYSMEAMLRIIRDELEPALSKMLFAE